MKSMICKYILPLLLAFSFAGCKKYLDVKPKGVDIVSNITHYNGLFNNTLLTNLSTFTPYVGGFSAGSEANMTIMMSPETFTTSPYSGVFFYPRYMKAYRWDATIYQADENAAEWNAFYQHIYTYNLIASQVMDAPDGTEQTKKELLAEARANRAYLHLLLVNLLGAPYNAATASGDPGVPIITKPEAAARSGPRASVQEVYDFVINELNAAIADLPANTVNRLRLAKPAALCMLGQAYFFQKKYDLALTQLNSAHTLLKNGTSPMRLYDYNATMPVWQANPAFPPNVPVFTNNEETICQRQVALYSTNRLVFLAPAYAALYDPADLRLRFFTGTDNGGAPYPALTRSAPFSFNYGPSMANLYLMLAECKARTNDVAGAAADLLYFREHRMPQATAAFTAAGRDALIRLIVDERFREYALTGYCWFDVRRLWDDPLFAGKNYVHTDDSGTYTLTEERLTLKIPPKIMNINPGMQDNP